MRVSSARSAMLSKPKATIAGADLFSPAFTSHSTNLTRSWDIEPLLDEDAKEDDDDAEIFGDDGEDEDAGGEDDDDVIADVVADGMVSDACPPVAAAGMETAVEISGGKSTAADTLFKLSNQMRRSAALRVLNG